MIPLTIRAFTFQGCFLYLDPLCRKQKTMKKHLLSTTVLTVEFFLGSCGAVFLRKVHFQSFNDLFASLHLTPAVTNDINRKGNQTLVQYRKSFQVYEVLIHTVIAVLHRWRARLNVSLQSGFGVSSKRKQSVGIRMVCTTLLANEFFVLIVYLRF